MLITGRAQSTAQVVCRSGAVSSVISFQSSAKGRANVRALKGVVRRVGGRSPVYQVLSNPTILLLPGRLK